MREAIKRLKEIQETMQDLLSEADNLINDATRENHAIVYNRASAYWLGHMESHLNDDGSYNTSFSDTIAELEKIEAGEDSDDCDD